MIIEGSEDTPLYHFVDADNLTITIRTSTKKVMGSDIMYKYTYNETAGTLTMTIYQRPFPTDTDAYLETFIGEWPSFYVGYEGDYEFYGKTDYITAERNFLLLKLKPRWDESWLSKFQMMEWEEYYNEKMEYANDVFSSSFSQDFYYNVEGDTVTLIDEEEYTYTLKFLHK